MNNAQIKGIRAMHSLNTTKSVTIVARLGQFGVMVDGKLAGVCATEAGALELAKVVG